jgi:chloramphenicol 3-O-phosphotransferase
MIVWLNGTFGAGKTTTAEALLPLLDGARLFDPETVGYMLGPNLADRPVTDFQHWPPWRSLVVATAAELIRYTGQHLIAPQTVLDRSYLAEIFEGLRVSGIDVFHVVLDADEPLLRHRIERSDEARQWRLDHLSRYQAARGWMTEEADLVVDTSAVSPDRVAGRIAAALPVSLLC